MLSSIRSHPASAFPRFEISNWISDIGIRREKTRGLIERDKLVRIGREDGRV